MAEDDWKTIARIARNATLECQIRTGTYWKIPVIDMRWYSDGKPTRKGLRINRDELPILIKALQKIEKMEVNRNVFHSLGLNINTGSICLDCTWE